MLVNISADTYSDASGEYFCEHVVFMTPPIEALSSKITLCTDRTTTGMIDEAIICDGCHSVFFRPIAGECFISFIRYNSSGSPFLIQYPERLKTDSILVDELFINITCDGASYLKANLLSVTGELTLECMLR